MRPSLVLALLACFATPVAFAQSGCGYASSVKEPPESKGVYPAAIRQVDGKAVGERTPRHRLTVGLHKLSVEERIADTRRGKAKLRQLAIKEPKQALKVLEIDVKADGSYHIGAKLLEQPGDPGKPQDYWEPVVWRTLLESCG